VSKKKPNITGAREESAVLPLSEPVSEPPAPTETSDGPPGPPPPRATRSSSDDGGGKRHKGPARVGFFGRALQFLRDVRLEMRRVTWPTKGEVYKTTIITIIAVIFFAAYLFLVDRVWAFLITQLENLLNWLTGVA
jgi:preprotein translocase subunit SecE